MHIVEQKNISHSSALALVNEAAAVAADMNIAIAACVLDTAGRIKAMLVMDGAPLIADELVQKKARTALLGLSSQEFAAAVQELPDVRDSMLQLSGMTLLGGGLPLISGGVLVGALAIGGGAVDQDVECARRVVDICFNC